MRLRLQKDKCARSKALRLLATADAVSGLRLSGLWQFYQPASHGYLQNFPNYLHEVNVNCTEKYPVVGSPPKAQQEHVYWL